MIGVRSAEPALLAARAGYERWAAQRPLPPGIRWTPAPEWGYGARWVATEGLDARAPVLLYVHGGGFRVGSVATGAPVAAAFAVRCRMRVLVAGYPLSPEHPFPSAGETVTAVLRGLLAEGTAPVLLAGDSAGANLVLLALRRTIDLPGAPVGTAGAPAGGAGAPAGAERIRGAVLLSPLVDLADEACAPAGSPGEADSGLDREMLREIRRDYLGDLGTIRDPDISPVHASLGGLPPLFLQYSASELLASSIAAFAARAEAHGVAVCTNRWEGPPHFWQRAVGDRSVADRAVDRAAAWVRRRVDDTPRFAG